MMRGRRADAAKAAAVGGKLLALTLGWGSKAALKMACTHAINLRHAAVDQRLTPRPA